MRRSVKEKNKNAYFKKQKEEKRREAEGGANNESAQKVKGLKGGRKGPYSQLQKTSSRGIRLGQEGGA